MKALHTASLILMVCGVAMAQEKKTFDQDLLDAIDKIAAQHGISQDEAMQKAHALCNDQEYWPVKGSVAIIRDSMFVYARERNGVVAGGKKTYGATSDFPELFLFAGKQFVGSLPVPKGSEDDVVVVLFTPRKVRFFDWKKLYGGYFDRQSEPNQALVPTATSVTPAADAPVAPAAAAAHL